MKINILEDKKNRFVFEIDGIGHTFINLQVIQRHLPFTVEEHFWRRVQKDYQVWVWVEVT